MTFGYVPERDQLLQAGVAVRAVRGDEEAADDRRDAQVLDRVADRDALLGRVTAGLLVEAHGVGLGGRRGHQVVGVGAALDPVHLADDRAVVDQLQTGVALALKDRVGLGDVDLPAEQVRMGPLGVPGSVVLERRGE